ncbi:MAG: hypothetical protein DMG32_16890 [Acidobacteria bacterium]|nr:MAG: hypothetical protein DMG32_16890 [Acidobacteriota bacterium]
MRATRPIRSLKVLFPCFVISFAVACHSSRPQRKSDPNAEEHVRQLIKSLPPGSEIRHRLEVGDRGDGLHYTWMDDMRGQGVKRALVESHFVWFFRPLHLQVVRVMYCREYDCADVQITDPLKLQRIRDSGLEQELKQVAMQQTKGSGWWFEVPRQPLCKHSASYVWLSDDEWLPEWRPRLVPIDRDATPLFDAASLGDEAGVAEFLSRGTDRKDRNDALWAAAAGRDTTVLKLLINAGADVNSAGPQGQTPLVFAVGSVRPANVEILLAAGAKLEARDPSGETALILVQHYVNTSAMSELLLNAGADPNAANQTGLTPLMEAARRQPGSVVRSLLSHGARLNATDIRGNTALMWAARGGNTEAVTALLAAHADPNAKNDDGETALSIASRKGHTEILDLLKSLQSQH